MILINLHGMNNPDLSITSTIDANLRKYFKIFEITYFPIHSDMTW